MPKTFVMVESGVRLHTTTFMREKGDTPNNFCIKVSFVPLSQFVFKSNAQLRKHIRTKRLEQVRQFGVDRVVDMTFGVGEVWLVFVGWFRQDGCCSG